MYTAPIQQTKTFVGLLRLALVPLSSKEQLAKDSDSKSLPLCAGVFAPNANFFSLLFCFIIIIIYFFIMLLALTTTVACL